MASRIRIAWLGVAAALLLFALPAAAQPVVGDVPLAGGGSERVMVVGPSAPRALLVMLAGGDGTVAIADNGAITHLQANFLLRTQPLWLAQGFAVAVLAPPNGASLLGQRHTPSYADAIDRAVDFARARVNAQVWLVGTSMGSIAAANGAAHLPGRVAGVVLTSSVASRTPAAGESVFDSDFGAIAVPALIVANQGDTCALSAPGFAPQIAAAMTRAPRRDVIYLSSSALQGPPREAMSPHGYLGIESEAVARIGGWIGGAAAR